MMLAPWRSPLARALHRNRSLAYARYLQLATVRPNGQPANRTVVFRGFLDDSNQLRMATDVRSQKIDQIQHQAYGELCWYFPKTREQFRLAGSLTMVTHAEPEPMLQTARRSLWHALSPDARSQFAWPDPGAPRTKEGSDLSSEAIADLDLDQPLDTFCLLLLDPDSVDHLDLRGEPQHRCLYERQGATWTSQSVNP
ncbi:Npun_F5749 family FMN-dependent PPOX-type flavoprotein [Leptolyngbya sp. CCY15150]|uniref:Npun_F5749 family FMN-dependent PPOX-type flavoprotein n=1 Tax=Leptolyngbya sp. CCY15150 TaxID=2767772 RepID=UPI0031BB2EE5